MDPAGSSSGIFQGKTQKRTAFFPADSQNEARQGRSQRLESFEPWVRLAETRGFYSFAAERYRDLLFLSWEIIIISRSDVCFFFNKCDLNTQI